MIPSCICSFATNNVEFDCKIFLKSLSCVHPNMNVILFVDNYIENMVKNMVDISLNINTVCILDLYSNKNRAQMEQEGIWTDFQMIKSNLIDYGLSCYPDVLYLDCDICFINPIEWNNVGDYSLLLSEHYISKWCTDQHGYYNGGVIWTNDNNFPEKWRTFTQTSRYFDQASLEDCAIFFKTGIIEENCNVAWWRIELADESREKMLTYFSVNDENIFYKNQPIIFVHTHFDINNQNYSCFNAKICELLDKCKNKKYLFELICK